MWAALTLEERKTPSSLRDPTATTILRTRAALGIENAGKKAGVLILKLMQMVSILPVLLNKNIIPGGAVCQA